MAVEIVVDYGFPRWELGEQGLHFSNCLYVLLGMLDHQSSQPSREQIQFFLQKVIHGLIVDRLADQFGVVLVVPGDSHLIGVGRQFLSQGRYLLNIGGQNLLVAGDFSLMLCKQGSFDERENS